MGHAKVSAVVGVCLAVVLGLAGSCPAQSGGGRLSGRWVGQDRHDYCGAVADAVKPNGYQDVHVTLAGLPPRQNIVFARVLGHGADEWQVNGVKNQHGAVLVRKEGATTADLFFEPNHAETGRAFTVTLKFDDGSEASVDVKGGRADPDLRMPELAVVARWVGQAGHDHTGTGPGVGPDGLQDAKIELAKVATDSKVRAVLVEHAPGASRWAFGVNRDGLTNAEFFPDEKDPTRGALYFHPARDLAGQTLRLTVVYENGKKDATTFKAGRTDPKLAMPRAALPRLSPVSLTARWRGQDGKGAGRGDVHVALTDLSVRKPVVAAVLSDGVRGLWAFRGPGAPNLDIEGDAAPLAFTRGTAAGSADLFFAPVRDESDTPMTLRLVFTDGESAVATVPGGACDPAKRAPVLAATDVAVGPGGDLAAAVERGGTVRLSKGEYRLSRPLVLNHPVTLAGVPGAVLVFSQPAGDAPWTTAIKVHAGSTTLKDFAVRFAGPVRWRTDVSWNPAVIGTTDNFDGRPPALLVNLTVSGLDLEGPPSSVKAPQHEEAVKLMRLTNTACGRISGNVLRGGLVEFFGGPWVVEGNDYRGTPPGTFAYSVFAAHDPYDLVLKGNKARPVGPCGKTWRFLGLTGRGYHDRVEDNVVEHIGPREDDTLTGFNSPEIMLTESYYLWFEGKPAAVSADGRLVRVGPLRGMAPRVGDVVSVVAGAGAGQYRRVAQRIDSHVLYLEAPLPKGSDVVSVSPGFVGDVWSGNVIDAATGRNAGGLILAGNHFGTTVKNNRIIGAGDAFRVVAFPSEVPNIWGWSHVPFFGALIEGNVIEDSERGGSVGVDHGPYVKSNKGRVYMTATLKDNIVRWSPSFLSHLAKARIRTGHGITIGLPGSIDPGELVVTESGDRLDTKAAGLGGAALKVNAGVLNGKPYTDKAFKLPPVAPAAAH